jgi:preprotein translocase subunit SecE
MSQGVRQRRALGFLETPKGIKMNFFKSAVQFFQDAYYELTKVTWLGRKEAAGTTVVVIIFVIIMSIFVYIVDFILGFIVSSIFKI